MEFIETAQEQFEQIVVFELAQESYGIDIGAVNTIIRMQPVTEVPQAPGFVEGVINLRGSIIPVVDLRKRFGLRNGEITKSSRIVVVESDDHTIGLIVDAVAQTLRLPIDAIEPPSSVVASVDSTYIRGIGKLADNLVILLELEKIFMAEQLCA